MKKKSKVNLVSYQDELIESLKDVEFAKAYLNEALNDTDQRVFLNALKNVMEAQGGSLSAIARKTKLNRENLYRMMSDKGNPELKSIIKLLNAVGMHISIQTGKPVR